jgi:beta-aspartyl-peptidase (threonine type)
VWSIIVHGGAGAIDASLEGAHRRGCERAVEAGRRVLEAGGAALDAVVAAVRALEEDPSFNAGIGATLDEDGLPTMDAAVMRGSDLAYGAVATVVGVRHPIDLARAVLDDGRHAILGGPGAVAFARRIGVELCDPALHVTERARAAFERARRTGVSPGEDWRPGTVGAVARDEAGDVAAATSTGGMLLERAGRIGDSPIAGAGTYARRDLGALSATGHGETMLRTVFAYSALLSLSEVGASEAVEPVLVRELEASRILAGGRGGAIAVLPDGRVGFARNTAHMGVAWARAGMAPESAF